MPTQSMQLMLPLFVVVARWLRLQASTHLWANRTFTALRAPLFVLLHPENVLLHLSDLGCGSLVAPGLLIQQLQSQVLQVQNPLWKPFNGVYNVLIRTQVLVK